MEQTKMFVGNELVSIKIGATEIKKEMIEKVENELLKILKENNLNYEHSRAILEHLIENLGLFSKVSS